MRLPILLPFERGQALPVMASSPSWVVVVLLLGRAWPSASAEAPAEVGVCMPVRASDGPVPTSLRRR